MVLTRIHGVPSFAVNSPISASLLSHTLGQSIKKGALRLPSFMHSVQCGCDVQFSAMLSLRR